MSEPGERRRRREAERTTDVGPDAQGPGGPPSRRAMRSQPVQSVGPDGSAGGGPYQVPGMGAESAAMRSRRTIRDTSLEPSGPRAPQPGAAPTRAPGAPGAAPGAWGAAPGTSGAPSRTQQARPSGPAPSIASPASAVARVPNPTSTTSRPS
ncbi:hypothetical protein AB6N24_21120, partial [Cellulomonas sp. 179-A 4D5 NHS]